MIEKVTRTGGPKAKIGFFTKNFGSVGIKFDTNIQGVAKDCAGIFRSLDVFGKGDLKQLKTETTTIHSTYFKYC